MPSKSPAQARLMAAVAHNPKFAKKTGIPKKVGEEYVKEDSETPSYEASKHSKKFLASALRHKSSSSKDSDSGTRGY